MENKDKLHSISNWIDYNRGQFFGIAAPVVIVICFAILGCSKTVSLEDSSVKVDRDRFNVECVNKEQELEQQAIDINSQLEKHNVNVEAFNQQKQAGIDNLDKQDEIKAQVLEIASGAVSQYATGGTVSTGALIMSAFNLAGIGWGVGNKLDNKRKDKIIEEKSQQA